jgi:hypothetical protein
MPRVGDTEEQWCARRTVATRPSGSFTRRSGNGFDASACREALRP